MLPFLSYSYSTVLLTSFLKSPWSEKFEVEKLSRYHADRKRKIRCNWKGDYRLANMWLKLNERDCCNWTHKYDLCYHCLPIHGRDVTVVIGGITLDICWCILIVERFVEKRIGNSFHPRTHIVRVIRFEIRIATCSAVGLKTFKLIITIVDYQYFCTTIEFMLGN